jgi:hypothetical protein
MSKVARAGSMAARGLKLKEAWGACWVLMAEIPEPSMQDAESRVNTNDYAFVTDIYTYIEACS